MSEVLALKYRPKQFSDLIGQEAISTTLSLALDTNKIANAYLFSGLRGSGKTSSARIFAKGLVCKNAPTSKPCEECDGCKAANKGNHIDIIEMDAASNRGIDDIKELIEHTKYKPASAKYKIFIIDEVHMLTTQAFNALLKTLEEPPEYVKFILATTDPLKLPATILSRTQHFRFKKIAPNIILNHLIYILDKEGIEFEKEALNLLIQSGNGSLRDTLTLLDQAIIYSKGIITSNSISNMLGLIEPNLIEEIFDTILFNKEINTLVDKLQNYEVGEILEQISLYLINCMKEKSTKFDIFMYDRFLRIIAESKQLLTFNTNSTFVLILTLMKMQEATNIKLIDEVIETEVSNKNLSKQDIILPKEQKVTLQTNNYQELFNQAILKIKNLSFEIGECFEKSFKFNKFENKKLIIDSYAEGECRRLLHKNFAKIREILEEVYNSELDFEFIKHKKENSPKTIDEKIRKIASIKPKETNISSSTIAEVELGGSCISNICAPTNPSEAQKELDLNDILNSNFVQMAKKYFLKEGEEVKIKNKI